MHEREPRFWDYAKAAAKPLFLLLVCAAFTVGQHFFNQWADGQEVYGPVVLHGFMFCVADSNRSAVPPASFLKLGFSEL